jgi:hypothetical protein
MKVIKEVDEVSSDDEYYKDLGSCNESDKTPQETETIGMKHKKKIKKKSEKCNCS